jgi:hypothetical protein
MKRLIAAVIAGIVIGSTGIGLAASRYKGGEWRKNGVLCIATDPGPHGFTIIYDGRGTGPGVVCGLKEKGGKPPSRLVAISNVEINVLQTKPTRKFLFTTSSR